MGRKRKTGKRAFAPKRDEATRLARQDVAREFGEEFRTFDRMPILARVKLRKKSGIAGGVVDNFFNKKFRKHLREKK